VDEDIRVHLLRETAKVYPLITPIADAAKATSELAAAAWPKTPCHGRYATSSIKAKNCWLP